MKPFSKRLTDRIMMVVVLSTVLMTVALFMVAGSQMNHHTGAFIQSLMDTENETISKMLTSVEVALINSVDEVEDNIDSPESVLESLKDELKCNRHIKAFFAAFEPYHFPKQGRWFLPYAVWQGDSIAKMQIGSDKNNYLAREWYNQALKNDSGYWSEPYIDETDLKEKNILCSFLLPLHDKSGRKIGVVGADISIDWLYENMLEIDAKTNETRINLKHLFLDNKKEQWYGFIVGKKGTYITHPDKSRILRDNFYGIARRSADTRDDHLARHMANRQRGMEQVEIDGIEAYVFYSPVKHTGWSIAIVVPKLSFYDATISICLHIIPVMLLGLFAVYFICRITIHRATRPLEFLAKSADEVAKGNFKAPLPTLRDDDELQLLRDSFANMQQSLSGYIEELKTTTAQKASMEHELNIAHRIQMAMLPTDFPHHGEINIHTSLTPAKAVGGDLYDFFIRDGYLFFCIGDVSGKGMPAALMMTVTRSMFRSYSLHGIQLPHQIITQMNEVMSEHNESCMFSTLFVGMLNLATGHLQYCSAGHEPPLLIADSVSRVPIVPNVPVGALPGTTYQLQELQMTPNSVLFLFTDGVNEARNNDNLLLGRDTVYEIAQQALADNQYAPQPLIERMQKTIADFVGDAEQSDDLTMLAVQWLTPHDFTLSSIDEIPYLSNFVMNTANSAGLDRRNSMHLRLAIEEAVVNVIKYSGAPDVTVTATVNNDQLQITISDTGKPFDPTATPAADINIPAEKRPIGGLGIHYIRRMCDHVDYCYKDSRNILTLYKNIK